jgi:hypothetical protein
VFKQRLARRIALIGVRHDGADEFFGVAAIAENSCALGGMLLVRGVVGVGPALVIKIVQQSGKSPEFFIGAGFASVGADTGFYGQHVLAQRFGLRVFTDKIPGFFAGWQESFLHVHSNDYWSTASVERESSRLQVKSPRVNAGQETQAVQLSTTTHFPQLFEAPAPEPLNNPQ